MTIALQTTGKPWDMRKGMEMKEYVVLKDGVRMPRMGLGTWLIGESAADRKQEIDAIRAGIEGGVTLIDTAEMYGDGRSENLVGEAIAPYPREDLFIVSKVLPSHAGKGHLEKSLDGSLRQLNTDYLDLYLLHWRGDIPFDETVACMEKMVEKGKIRRWGVSNFDSDDMRELLLVPGGDNCMVNQVLYHLGSRGIEHDLLSYMEEERIPVMAYCPLAQAGSLRREMMHNQVLERVAAKYGIGVIELLLLFVLKKENVVAIPRSSSKKHVLANLAVRNVELAGEDYEAICREYPAPVGRVPLDVV